MRVPSTSTNERRYSGILSVFGTTWDGQQKGEEEEEEEEEEGGMEGGGGAHLQELQRRN